MNALGRLLAIALVLLLVVFAAAWLLNRHDHRTPEEKLGDAVDSGVATVASATSQLTDTSTVSSASSAISKAGDATGAAVSKAGDAASSALSEASEDVKAASNRQKQQERQNARSSSASSHY
jgi:signal transduction histidine kinase